MLGSKALSPPTRPRAQLPGLKLRNLLAQYEPYAGKLHARFDEGELEMDS